MRPGNVIEQLKKMNENLEHAAQNANKVLENIGLLEDTTYGLQGSAYENLRNYYSCLHIPILHGIVLYVEEINRENSMYMGYIEGFLAGIGYVDEDGLENDKLSLEHQISQVYNLMSTKKGSFSDYMSSLQHALELVEKKLEKIGAFKIATSGLFQNTRIYKTQINNCMDCLKSDFYNVDTKKYNVDSLVELEELSQLEERWKNKDLAVDTEMMTLKEASVMHEYLIETDLTAYNIVYGSNEHYPSSVIEQCRQMLNKKMVNYLSIWRRWQELGDIEEISIEEIHWMQNLKRDVNGIVYIDEDVEVPDYNFEEFQCYIVDNDFRQKYLYLYAAMSGEDENSSIGRVAAGYTILNRLEQGETIDQLVGNKTYQGYSIETIQKAEISLTNQQYDPIRNEVMAVMLGDVSNPIGNRTYFFGRYDNVSNITFNGNHIEDCIVVGSNEIYKNVYYFEYGTLHNVGNKDGIIIYDSENGKWSCE